MNFRYSLLALIPICFLVACSSVAKKTQPEGHDLYGTDWLKCEVSDDCVVVSYSHCCGTTKAAINKKYVQEYESHPEWHVSPPGACTNMGACMHNDDFKTVTCENTTRGKECNLKP